MKRCLHIKLKLSPRRDIAIMNNTFGDVQDELGDKVHDEIHFHLYY